MSPADLNKVLDLIPDPQAKAQAAVVLQTYMLDFAHQQMLAQGKITNDEEDSTDPFSSRARPFILWVCGVALAYTFVTAPFLNPILRALLPGYVPVVLDEGSLASLVTAMLGLGGMHVYEGITNNKTAAGMK